MTFIDLTPNLGAIVALYRNGTSSRWLAQRYGCSRSTILRRLVSAGVAVHPRGRQPRKVRA